MHGLAGCSNLRLRMLLHSMQTGSLTLSTASCSRGWPSRFSSCSPLIHQVYPFPGGNALSSHRGHTCSPVGEDPRSWQSTHVLPSNCFGIGVAYGVFGSVHSSGLSPAD
jgi:hypothetical protein